MKTHCKHGHEKTPENLYPNGACRPCTKIRNHSPEMKAYCMKYRTTPEGKALLGVHARKFKYGFTPEDEQHFQTIKNCDFCDLPFEGETPHVDHDHSCCPGAGSCKKCRRGFVHRTCNQHWILSLEWYEKLSGITDPRLL